MLLIAAFNVVEHCLVHMYKEVFHAKPLAQEQPAVVVVRDVAVMVGFLLRSEKQSI